MEPIIEVNGTPIIKVDAPQKVYDEKKKILLEKRIIWYVWLVIEVLLLLHLLVNLFDGNPFSIFTVIITIATFPLIFPFKGLFIIPEYSILFAMFFYSIISLVVSRFFRLKKPIDPVEAEVKIDTPVI